MAIPGAAFPGLFRLATCSEHIKAPASPTPPGLLFVENRAQEKAGACTGSTLIKIQELGSALVSMLEL